MNQGCKIFSENKKYPWVSVCVCPRSVCTLCEHVVASLRMSHDLSSDRSLVTVVSGRSRMGNITNVGIVLSARQSLLSLPQFVCLAPSLGVFIKYLVYTIFPVPHGCDDNNYLKHTTIITLSEASVDCLFDEQQHCWLTHFIDRPMSPEHLVAAVTTDNGVVGTGSHGLIHPPRLLFV